jgi:hypothetical protein
MALKNAGSLRKAAMSTIQQLPNWPLHILKPGRIKIKTRTDQNKNKTEIKAAYG